MEGDFIKINEWLLPFSWLYGIGVKLRNFLFDIGILKTHTFHIPVIAVGNITVGGTGKTPHVEYLIRLLQDHVKVAVLSRGYKRKTSGFVMADKNSTARDIGDEPYQMKLKFPKATVAVDKKRVRGIQTLTQIDDKLDVVLLDDAFQHRYVKPGVNILLVDYHRLIIYDKLLPAGRLREPLKGKNRADIVIVTKCPKDLKPMEFRVITKAMNLYAYQHLYFTTFEYGTMTGIFNNSNMRLDDITSQHNILLLTGIASPRQLSEDLAGISGKIWPMEFPDHHDFSKKDIQRINQMFDSMTSPRLIITTEKDAARIRNAEGFSEDVKQAIYTLPIRVSFMQDQEDNFNENIIGYVRKNSRNSILVKRKDDHKAGNGDNPGDRPRTISFRNN